MTDTPDATSGRDVAGVTGDEHPMEVDSGPTDHPGPTGTPSWAWWLGAVLVVVVGAVLVLALASDRPPSDVTASFPTAPTGPVEATWQVPLAFEFGTGQVVRHGDMLVVVDAVPDGGRVRGIDVATGDVAWAHEPAHDEVTAVVTGGTTIAVEQVRTAVTPDRLVGRALEDGAQLWELPVDASFEGWAMPDGRLAVSGNGQCGQVRPTDGQIVRLQPAPSCRPRGNDMVVLTGSSVQLQTAAGEVVYDEAPTGTDPLRVGDEVVSADGARVVSQGPDDGERWARSFDTDVQDLQAWGDGQVAVTLGGCRGSTNPCVVLLDGDGTRRATLQSGLQDAVEVDGQLWVVADGTERLELSRPGEPPTVVTPPSPAFFFGAVAATDVGVLAATDGMDDTDLALYAYPDLSVTWTTPITAGLVIAFPVTDPDLLVVQAVEQGEDPGAALVALRPADDAD
ncbi:PQQ-binding-like beta-propeller repeat protein [Salsipaludibacter albus]|uniref:outer membrane protein assembly factor BamB family protein n=1 Tax=Salsipaludibacter albus TaxID=2849650 RepID=UPI001EE49B83|nr:PQQ-binding-like beta-propeller repeat protein [Salsipaludibacter albus]MBY5163119.1 PQQ-like beta-propeller repeat protein [Salsipaludibacter albus]